MIETIEQYNSFLGTGVVPAATSPEDWSNKRAIHELATLDNERTVYMTVGVFIEINRLMEYRTLKTGVAVVATGGGFYTLRVFVDEGDDDECIHSANARL